MRATMRAALIPRGTPPSGLSRRFASPVAFFTSVVFLLGAVVYLCAVLARALTPAAAAIPVSLVAGEQQGRVIAVTPGPPAASDASLLDAITTVLAGVDDRASVAVLSLDGSRQAFHEADRVWYAASTFKLALLYEAERRHAAGELEYDDRLVLTEEALSEDLGTIDRVPIAADGTLSIGEALTAMVTLSDNATAVALLRHLGPAEVDATLRDLGLTTMSVNTEELPVTVTDLARLMRAIVSGEGVGEEERGHMRGLLLEQTIRDGLPAGLPVETAAVTGNKTGTWLGTTGDVAFVETPGGTYVIAVFAEGDWNWPLLRDLSAAVFDAMASGR